MYVSFATNDDNFLKSSIAKIENCLSDINLWMTANKLNLNKSKHDLIYLNQDIIHGPLYPASSLEMIVSSLQKPSVMLELCLILL